MSNASYHKLNFSSIKLFICFTSRCNSSHHILSNRYDFLGRLALYYFHLIQFCFNSYTYTQLQLTYTSQFQTTAIISQADLKLQQSFHKPISNYNSHFTSRFQTTTVISQANLKLQQSFQKPISNYNSHFTSRFQTTTVISQADLKLQQSFHKPISDYNSNFTSRSHTTTVISSADLKLQQSVHKSISTTVIFLHSIMCLLYYIFRDSISLLEGNMLVFPTSSHQAVAQVSRFLYIYTH